MLQLWHDNISLVPLPSIRIDLQRVDRYTFKNLTPAVLGVHGGCALRNSIGVWRMEVAHADERRLAELLYV